jgi:hypothetical protein
VQQGCSQLRQGTLPEDADRFVILSASRSVSGHVLEPLTVSCTAPVPTTSVGSRSPMSKVSVNGARFAQAFQDEGHDEKGEGTTVKVFLCIFASQLCHLSRC